MTRLHRAVRDTIGVDHPIGAGLTRRAQVKVVLEELADELPAGGLEADLELLMCAAGGL